MIFVGHDIARLLLFEVTKAGNTKYTIGGGSAIFLDVGQGGMRKGPHRAKTADGLSSAASKQLL